MSAPPTAKFAGRLACSPARLGEGSPLTPRPLLRFRKPPLSRCRPQASSASERPLQFPAAELSASQRRFAPVASPLAALAGPLLPGSRRQLRIQPLLFAMQLVERVEIRLCGRDDDVG